MVDAGRTDRPLGPEVDPSPAPRPDRRVLDGRFVRLEPLDPARHGPALWRGLVGAEPVWDYLFDGPYADEASFARELERKAASSDPLFWTAVEAYVRQQSFSLETQIYLMHFVAAVFAEAKRGNRVLSDDEIMAVVNRR